MHKECLNGRTMLVRRAEVIPIEAIVRGYLAGSFVQIKLHDGFTIIAAADKSI
jgi:phosphoribosylaminoimidazole-succinocarboxamide synthase